MVLYDQFDNPSGTLASSQNFEPAFSNYSDQVADDFVVPSGQTWSIDQVEVGGSYSNSGHADSVNVYFYADNFGPSTPVFIQTNVVPSAGLANGNFTLPLTPPAVLPPGTYWLSVQANQSLVPNGQWFWRNRRSASGSPAYWQNPGGGFGTFCTTWHLRGQNCSMSFMDPDQIFRLDGGSNVTPSPTPTITPTPTGTPPTPTRTYTPPPPPLTATPTRTGIVPPPVETQAAPLTPAPPTLVPTVIPPCAIQWSMVTSPSPATRSDLWGVAALSQTDVWAVGSAYDGSIWRTLTEHWDGYTWSVVPSPDVTSSFNTLIGVAARAPNDIWAVGSASNLGPAQPLILHWNGAAWSVVPNPNLPNGGGLNGVAIVGANDVWAVGFSNGFNSQTLIEHWNGSAWTVVSSPNPAFFNTLTAVTALAANDVWAAGWADSSGAASLILHWNGSVWNTVSVPFIPFEDRLNGIAARAPNDIWAVGTITTYPDYINQTLIFHWDGANWSQVASPNPGFSGNGLNAVTILSATDAWAVGYIIRGSQYNASLTAHWNGTTWDQVPSPNQGEFATDLKGVAGNGPTDVWAVGAARLPGTGNPLGTWTEHSGNPCAPPPPTNTATVMPTATPTATATATVCPLQFTDVPHEQPVLPLHPLPGLPGHPQRLHHQPALRRRAGALLPARRQRHPRPGGQDRRQRRRLSATPSPRRSRPSPTCRPAARSGSTSSGPSLHGVISGYTHQPALPDRRALLPAGQQRDARPDGQDRRQRGGLQRRRSPRRSRRSPMCRPAARSGSTSSGRRCMG